MNRVGFLIGLAFGFLIAGVRLNDYDVLHNMLLLREPDLFLLMASAIAVAGPLLWLLRRRRWQTLCGGALDLKRYPVARKDILGAIVFGAGWAVAGSCPGAALTMAAGGKVLGVVVVAGLFAGLALRDASVAQSPAQQPAHSDAAAVAVSR